VDAQLSRGSPGPSAALLWRLCAYNFLGDFVLIYPLYALMMEQRGLSPFQLSTLFIVWSVTAFAAEVPTGVLADRLPRRWLLAANGVLTALGYLTWLFFPAYGGFLAGFVLWGLGGACASGAYEALLHDELRLAGCEQRFTEVYGRTRAAAFCGIVCAGLGASLAVHCGWGYPALLLASAVSGLAVTLVALSLPVAGPCSAGQRPRSPAAVAPSGEDAATEDVALKSHAPQIPDEPSYFDLLRSGLAFALRSRRLLWLMLLIGVATSIYGCLEEYFALLARDSGLPEVWQGLLMAAIAGSQAVAAAQAWRFTRRQGHPAGAGPPAESLAVDPPYGRHEPGKLRRGDAAPASRNAVALLLGVSAVLLLGAAVWHAPPGLAGLILFCAVYTIAETQLAGQLQALLPDGQRATLTSLSAFSGEVWGVLAYLGVGAVATRWSYATAFAAGAAILLLTAAEYWRGSRWSAAPADPACHPQWPGLR
jgi:MFS family permease